MEQRRCVRSQAVCEQPVLQRAIQCHSILVFGISRFGHRVSTPLVQRLRELAFQFIFSSAQNIPAEPHPTSTELARTTWKLLFGTLSFAQPSMREASFFTPPRQKASCETACRASGGAIHMRVSCASFPSLRSECERGAGLLSKQYVRPHFPNAPGLGGGELHESVAVPS